jgi:uncharacterized protein involved in exopolysaccharide biosynthesis
MNKSTYYTPTEMMQQIKALFHHVTSKWYLVLIAGIAGIALGLTYFYLQKPRYDSVCTFILEEKQSGMGGLGSIASQFGIDVGGTGSGGSIFAGDNILDILKSKKIIFKVLQTKLKSATGDSISLADAYLMFSGLKKKWQNDAELSAVSFSNANTPLNQTQDSVMNIIYDGILKKNLVAERVNKKGSIIKVVVSSADNLFSILMTQRAVEEASKLYLSVKTSTSNANINRMQRRSDSLLMLLNNKSFNAAIIQQNDVNPGLKSVLVPTEIAMRDKTVIATLYTEVTKNLEASKMLLSQQSPVIQILDSPGPSQFDNRKKILPVLVIFSILTMCVSIGIIILSYFIRKNVE